MMLLAAVLAASPHKRANMPAGWTWPPSPAMHEAGARCLAQLDAAQVRYRAGEPVKKIATPIELPDMTVGGIELVPLRVQRRTTMDCHLAAALAEVAPALRELGVRALHYRTMHEHRRVRKGGRFTKTLSRHALGLALDVFEVALDDGRVLRIKTHWRRHARILPKIASVFSRSPAFRNPLTPTNDRLDHDDHIHLEAHMLLETEPARGESEAW